MEAMVAVGTLAAFVTVILLVPWLMARPTPRETDARPPTESHGPASLFLTARERRLWIWTLVVVAAIYATLAPAAGVAAALRERGLLGPTTATLILAMAAGFAVVWARTRPGPLELGVGVGVVAVYAATVFRLPAPEARSHLFEYGLVAMLIFHALDERRRAGGRAPPPALGALVATALLGWLDEGIQALLPNRVYDLLDVRFNALAGLMAIVATLLMRWARRPTGLRALVRRWRRGRS